MASPSGHAADVRAARDIGRLLAARRHAATVRFGLRLDDLLQLIEAHHAVGGREAGRRRRTDALNRAALIVLTDCFEGFVLDLFQGRWATLYPSSDPAPLLRRMHFNNPWPDDIDSLFALVGIVDITKKAEGRPTASSAAPSRTASEPMFVRERGSHQIRQVVAEMIALRNVAVHVGAAAKARLSDVTAYLNEVRYLAVEMSGRL